jgi:hypothetical protein
MAAASRSVLRQVENEISNRDAETTQLKKDLQKVGLVDVRASVNTSSCAVLVLRVHAVLWLQGHRLTKQKVQRKAVVAAHNSTTASGRSAMRRSGRAGGATVNYM